MNSASRCLCFPSLYFLGGLIYMYLNNSFSDNERLKLVDMPYYMLAFMVLESPISVPDEPYLIVFWYALPLLAVYVLGRGAADFSAPVYRS